MIWGYPYFRTPPYGLITYHGYSRIMYSYIIHEFNFCYVWDHIWSWTIMDSWEISLIYHEWEWKKNGVRTVIWMYHGVIIGSWDLVGFQFICTKKTCLFISWLIPHTSIVYNLRLRRDHCKFSTQHEDISMISFAHVYQISKFHKIS